MRKFFSRIEIYMAVMAVSLIVGIGIGILLPIQTPFTSTPDQYEDNPSYHFINPLLSCGDDSFSRIQVSQMSDLQAKINAYISAAQAKGSIDTASLYFRELNGGQNIAINPTVQFVPASLLKVPLAMSIYQQAEQTPGFLQSKVFNATDSAPASEHYTAPTISASSTYSVEQLVDSMLINSDNNAALLLTHVISTADLDEAYSNLGVVVPQTDEYTMTVSTYAGFFRVLYNATYLSHDDSEHMLDLLSQTSFNQGIVAGLPQGIPVAHKFGERGFNDPTVPNQLHDCGIVYAKKPYLVCIMTQGSDYNTLAGAIADMSRMIYEYAGP